MMRTIEQEPRTITPPLRAVREANGLGLREVARRASIDPSQLSRVERGHSSLSVDALARLAQVLGLAELERLLRPYVVEGVKPNANQPRRGSARPTK